MRFWVCLLDVGGFGVLKFKCKSLNTAEFCAKHDGGQALVDGTKHDARVDGTKHDAWIDGTNCNTMSTMVNVTPASMRSKDTALANITNSPGKFVYRTIPRKKREDTDDKVTPPPLAITEPPTAARTTSSPMLLCDTQAPIVFEARYMPVARFGNVTACPIGVRHVSVEEEPALSNPRIITRVSLDSTESFGSSFTEPPTAARTTSSPMLLCDTQAPIVFEARYMPVARFGNVTACPIGVRHVSVEEEPALSNPRIITRVSLDSTESFGSSSRWVYTEFGEGANVPDFSHLRQYTEILDVPKPADLPLQHALLRGPFVCVSAGHYAPCQYEKNC